ncbi:MAG TPA: ImmA/IrrE family metallo-endopeptidase [Solirubrobacteraceae bacterium]|nr:ImmA/IrrE family metallo-endopeptidase [Solirubrobacteraceae bacterium]
MATTSHPEQAAAALLREFETRFRVAHVPPVPVERIAASLLDLLIEECDDVRSVPGAPADQGRLSGMIVPATRIIWLDRTECARSRGRRRFTIAHECGHWVLHIAGAQQPVTCRPEDVSEQPDVEKVRQLRRLEAEANVFARELLMPESLVVEHAHATGCNLAALAERFDVSVPAIRLRLLTLGLLPAWMASVPTGSRR